MIHVMIIYDVVNIFSLKNYKSSRKLRVGLNWYPGVNWSTTTTSNFTLALGKSDSLILQCPVSINFFQELNNLTKHHVCEIFLL